MAYCQTVEQLEHIDDLNYHKARCVLCKLIAAGEQNDGIVPIALALELGLVPHRRPGNAWINAASSTVVEVKGHVINVG